MTETEGQTYSVKIAGVRRRNFRRGSLSVGGLRRKFVQKLILTLDFVTYLNRPSRAALSP